MILGKDVSNAPNDLIVFVHIPKTAGSSVNSFLSSELNGAAHVEQYMSDLGGFLKKASKLDWVSGHVPIMRFEKIFAEFPRRIRYCTLLREPYSQVMSHFNWLIEIYHRGEKFYNNHPDHIKAMSHNIRSSDLSDPNVIIRLLDRYNGLFLNFQTKHLYAPKEDINTDWINKFSLVMPQSKIRDFLCEVLGREVNFAPKENASKYHFDRSIFQTAKMRDFLAERNQKDIKAYELVLSKSGNIDPSP